ncbi:MAG: S41 family peptidase [Bacteroidetes bacterium]|nr:S41 family peptidase [Bacteroidota bacterium]
MKKLVVAILSLGCISLSAQSFVRFARLSPDGQSMSFSYQGDIWYWSNMEGKPHRLSLHESYDGNSVFSPDGKQLAFNSSRFGNGDIFTIDVEGGTPVRKTWHAAGDAVSDWHKELGIVFTSERAYVTVEWNSELHRIDPNNATPFRFMDGLGANARISPNGKLVAFTRGSCKTSRENYIGPADQEIWLYDIANDRYTQLTDNDFNDISPKWMSDNQLLILSAREGRYNLKELSLGGDEKWVTNFSDEGIHDFDIAAGKILFARKDQWFFGDYSQAQNLKALKIDLKNDYRFYPEERKTIRNAISNYSLSPDGEKVVIETRGEVFVGLLDDEKSRTINLSDHPFYDREAIFLNDSTVVFSSDREADQYRFYKANSSDPDKTDIYKSLRHERAPYFKSNGDLRSAVLSPDGSKLAYLEGGQKLQVSEVNEDGSLGSTVTLLEAWHGAGGLAWSPDNQYLAYHRDDLNFNTEVFIQAVDGKSDAVNVSMHPGSDYSASWSKDGSKLAFVSDRNNDDADIWFVWLQREEWLKSEQEREEGYYFEEEKEDDEKDKDEKSKEKKEKVEPLNIDFENIYDRLQQVTYYSGRESSVLVSADGEKLYFTRYSVSSKGSDLYEIKYDGSDLKQLTKGGTNPYNLKWDKDQKGIYFISRGRLKHIKLASSKVTSYSYEEKMNLNKPEERKQVFAEASRLIRDRFYDPEFHGNDWDKLNSYYRDWALKAATDEDFNFVYNLMLGRLNASHMGMYGSGEAEVQRESTGRLGIEVKMSAKGAMVSRVVNNTPADRSKNNLMVGDIITHVNGEQMGPEQNFYSYWTATSGDPVLVKLKRESTEMEIVILPSRSIGSELYEEWVQSRKALVEKYSKGRLGYIHIRGMDMQSFERFERELMASGYGKDGIVIDVRFNGGGWTTDYLMAVLNVRQHAYTIPRGAAKSLNDNKKFSDYYPYSERLPLAAWTKPSVALCNESSYSNAEIFSHAYKTLDIGTLVGQPTFGAVISTSGSSLLNGNFIRLPFRAWYVKKTGENMENGPAVPDVLVENPPASRAKNEDAQLKKAVEILLEQIENPNK